MDAPDPFGSWLTAWNEIADTNRAAIGEGWALGQEAIELQIAAVKLIQTSQYAAPDRERALVSLVVHMTRLEASCFALATRGYADTASYLLRGLDDAQSLVMGAIWLPDTFIAELLAGEKQSLAADARIALVAFFRESGKTELAEMAEMLNERFNLNRKSGNGLAHLQAYHLVRVLGVQPNGRWAPTPHGIPHEMESRAIWAGVLELVAWCLMWLDRYEPVARDAGWQKRHDTFVADEDRYRSAANAAMKKQGETK